jgi:hypothetical protein
LQQLRGKVEVRPNWKEMPIMPPDFWRKRGEEARRLAELIEDNFTAETLLDIALQYDELGEQAERRQRRSD